MSDFEFEGNEILGEAPAKEEQQSSRRVEKKKKKRRRGKNKAAVVIVVLLIITSLFTLFLNMDNPAFRDFFAWVGLSSTNNGTTIEFDKTEKYDICELNGNIVLARNANVACIDNRLNARWSIEQGNSAPVIKTSGRYALTYSFDVANAVLTKDGKSVNLPTDNPIIAASVNKNGYSVLVTREKGYKAQAVVHSPDGNVIYKWHSADNYIVDVDISQDNRTLAVATVDFSTDTVSGGIMFFNFSQDKPYYGQIFKNNLMMEIQFVDKDSLMAVGDLSTILVKTNGDVEGEYSYNGKKLNDYDIGTDFSLVLVLSQSDSVMDNAEIKFVDKKLKEKGTVVVEDSVSSVDSVRGRTLVAMERRLVLMNNKGKELKSIELNRDVKKAVLFGNGKSALVASGSIVELIGLK